MPAKKDYTEAEMIVGFGLTRLKNKTTPAMERRLGVPNAELTSHQQFFSRKY